MLDAGRSPWKNGNPLLLCPLCAGAVCREVWRANGVIFETVEDGVAVRLIRGAPEWAALYAVQGFEQVTRYVCSACATITATLAHDPD